MEDIKVRMFKCKCGKARMLSVIRPNGKDFSKDVKKEHRALLEAGLMLKLLPLLRLVKKNCASNVSCNYLTSLLRILLKS